MTDLIELMEIMPNRVCLHDAELKLMQTKIDCLQAKIVEMTRVPERATNRTKSSESEQLEELKLKYREL
jgi:hypothetical protein